MTDLEILLIFAGVVAVSLAYLWLCDRVRE